MFSFYLAQLFSLMCFSGSLVQVENYQLVVERFLKTDFPSWEHLENLEHVREKKTRWVPLFSVQVKSSLSSSLSILDYGKPSYQHSISVPKHQIFAICIKWALSQHQSHHLTFVQSTCCLGAALHFTLFLCSCWVPVGHSPDVFFPDKCLFRRATCQE